MARHKKFNEPGAKEDRIRWNKAGTRKWLTVYTVMEYHPKERAKLSDGEAEKPKKAKPKKAKPKKTEATEKPTTKGKARQPKPASE